MGQMSWEQIPTEAMALWYFAACSEASATAGLPIKRSAKLLFPSLCVFPDNEKKNTKSSSS